MLFLEKVTKKTKRQVLLNNITLSIQEGNKIALLGANGAGKTTLIRALLGHYKVRGKIQIFGEEPRKNRVELMQNIAFAPQYAPPIPMSVNQIIHFNASIHQNLEEKKIWDIVEPLGVSKEKDGKKFFVKLSGGMQQKLLIAIALAKSPKLLIMDEPTASLDISGREFLIQELKKLRDDQSFLITSHRIKELSSIINRKIEMDFGNIVLDESQASFL